MIDVLIMSLVRKLARYLTPRNSLLLVLCQLSGNNPTFGYTKQGMFLITYMSIIYSIPCVSPKCRIVLLVACSFACMLSQVCTYENSLLCIIGS